jgi:hypothetical protein
VPVIQHSGRQHREFKASLGYETLSQNKQTNKTERQKKKERKKEKKFIIIL